MGGVGRRYLARLAVESGPSGLSAVAYVDLKPVATLPLAAFAPTATSLGGKGACFGLVSLR